MILVLVMAFNTSVALALGFVLGRIYQIRSDQLERRAEPPPVADFRNLDYEGEPGRRSAAKLLGKAFPRRTTPMSDVRTAWPSFSGPRSTISRAYRRTDIACL